MSWTLSLMYCLLVINCGDAAPIDIVNEAMVNPVHISLFVSLFLFDYSSQLHGLVR